MAASGEGWAGILGGQPSTLAGGHGIGFGVGSKGITVERVATRNDWYSMDDLR